MMETACAHAPDLSRTQVCQALGVWRGRRWRRARDSAFAPDPLMGPKRQRKPPRMKLQPLEAQAVLAALYSPRFAHCSPAHVHATLLDEGCYLASVRTMYRLLSADGASAERRRQLTHPAYARPELLATRPNQVWSWDITKLKGPAKWTCFHLYVILDIFSRQVVGWMIAPRECAQLARDLIEQTLARHNIGPHELTLHADRGASMRSKPVASLLVDLGVSKSHSRPYVSDDNPFSEAQFKTLKYHHDFPQRFTSLQEARAYCEQFFAWYNTEHRHSGLAMMTPQTVHNGQSHQVQQARQAVMTSAFATHPERFVNGSPLCKHPPSAVWINPPIQAQEVSQKQPAKTP